jgi:hypothetical protein
VLLEAVRGFLESYQRGLAAMDAHTPSWRDRVVDERLRKEIEARCNPIQLLQVRSFLQRRGKAVAAVRKGDLDASRREFQRAEQAFQSLARPELRLVCESLYCSAFALLFYRCGEPGRARELVERAIAIDAELETELGVGVLYGHRYQLVWSLIQLEARFGDLESATAQGLAMLEQLEGKPGAAPTRHRWSPSDTHALPSELRRALASKLVFQLAVIHLRSNARDAQSKHYAEHVRTCQASPANLAVEAHQWLSYAAQMEACRLVDAVNLSTEYLRRGPGDVPALWYCVVLHCAERLSLIDSPEAASAAAAIERDRATWPHAPSVLRGRLALRKPIGS